MLRTKRFLKSEMVIRSQIQIKNDAFTPPNLTNNEWKDFGERKATLGNNTRFGEKIWRQDIFLQKLFLIKSLPNDIFVSLD